MNARTVQRASAGIWRQRRTVTPPAPPPFMRPVVIPPHLLRFVEHHRQHPTPAEVKLSSILSTMSGKLKWPILSQYPLPPFIVDFICLPRKLIIEVDGGYHDAPAQQAYDAARTAYFERAGYRVIRFKNAQIFAKYPCQIIDRITFYL